MKTRTIHFRTPPASTAPETPSPSMHAPEARAERNPLDAIGAIARDIALLHDHVEQLIADRDGRHGRLCGMNGAARRIQLQVQALLEIEER